MDVKSKKKAFLAASVAGLLVVAGTLASSGNVFAEDVKCDGGNACAGQGACGGKNHACAGINSCKGQGWIKTATADECTKLGGTVSTTPAMM